MNKDNDNSFPRIMMVGLPSGPETLRLLEMMGRPTPVVSPIYHPAESDHNFMPVFDTMTIPDPLFHIPPAISRPFIRPEPVVSNSMSKLRLTVAFTALMTNMTHQSRRLINTIGLREDAKRLERMIQKQPHRGDLKLKLIGLRNQIREIEKENADRNTAKQKAQKRKNAV